MAERKKSPSDLRSHRYFGRGPFSFEFRQRTLQQGYELSEFVGRPVIVVINTWSEMNTCHAHLRERAQVVKRGVWQAGGFPVEIPAMSLGEIMMRPTTMLYRNLLAMETEEGSAVTGTEPRRQVEFRTMPILRLAGRGSSLPSRQAQAVAVRLDDFIEV